MGPQNSKNYSQKKFDANKSSEDNGFRDDPHFTRFKIIVIDAGTGKVIDK